MTAISYHDTVNDLQDLDWSADTPFARLQWFRLLEESGMQPLLVTARAGREGIALPLREAEGKLESLTNWYAFTWGDLRTMGVADEQLLEALARDLAQRAARVDLTKLTEEDGTLDRLQNAFGKAGWLAMREKCDSNHVLPVRGRSYDQFLASRPGPLRTTLSRKAKKLAVSLATEFSAEDWSAYEDIYADSWKPAEGDPVLLRCFAEQESAGGRYRFALGLHDGVPVAAQFWTVDGTTAYIHKLAHRESARMLSPGTTLTAVLMQRVIDVDGVELVDFGTGDDAYKRDWMDEVRTRWRLTCLRPSSPRNWSTMGKALLRKLVSRNRAG